MDNLSTELAVIAENSLEITIIFDSSGRMLWANGQFFEHTDYTADEIGDISLTDILPGVFGMSGDSVTLKFDKFLPDFFQTSVYRKNHTCFPVNAKLKSFDDTRGRYYFSAIDISDYEEVKKELKWTKRDAEEAMKERNEFVANVTHELRTPVSGILGHTRNALDGELTPEVNNTLRIIERCCGDMNKIIDNILDFSKLEAGKFVLEEREFDFKDFVDHIIETHIARINEKGLKFVFSMDDNVPKKVIGDSYHISQIINNLISNAIKFTSMGKITLQIVKTMQQGDLVELFFVVMDTGIGIKDEDKDKLFKSFSQVDASVSRKYGGTGLGLAVCKQIVEMMHGSINVESQHGHGSMFSFSIQIKVPESEIDSNAESNVTTIEAVKEQIMQGQDSSDEEGQAADLKTIQGILEKLILCIEMESWEKAEMFADSLKQVLVGYPGELRRFILRMEMSVRKEDHDKAIDACEKLRAFLEEQSYVKAIC